MVELKVDPEAVYLHTYGISPAEDYLNEEDTENKATPMISLPANYLTVGISGGLNWHTIDEKLMILNGPYVTVHCETEEGEPYKHPPPEVVEKPKSRPPSRPPSAFRVSSPPPDAPAAQNEESRESPTKEASDLPEAAPAPLPPPDRKDGTEVNEGAVPLSISAATPPRTPPLNGDGSMTVFDPNSPTKPMTALSTTSSMAMGPPATSASSQATTPKKPDEQPKFTTKTAKPSVTPEWNQTFGFTLAEPHMKIVFNIYDTEFHEAPQFIGSASVYINRVSADTRWLLIFPARTFKRFHGLPGKKLQEGSKLHVQWFFQRRSTLNNDLPELKRRAAAYLAKGMHSHAFVAYSRILQADPQDSKAKIQLQVCEAHLKQKPPVSSTFFIPTVGLRFKRRPLEATGVPVTNVELRHIYDHLDPQQKGWITKDQFKEIFLHWEHYGAPSEETVEKEADQVVEPWNIAGPDKLTFEEFAILMLQLSRR